MTIVEFNDFYCPYCSKMVAVLDEVVKSYPGKVRLIVKDFPLEFHRGSELAHEACLAAKAQGKYWEMYHLLFANQRHLERSDLEEYAKRLGLDLPQFDRALDRHEYWAEIRDSVAEGKALGVTATPTFFLAGRKLQGAQSERFLEEQLESALDLTPKRAPSEAETESASLHGDDAGQGTALAGLVVANSPVKGEPDAAVTITEFADFECPYCASSRGVVDEVLREFPGRVKVVFKSFPLDFHADSKLAHQAALAAGQQGKFWEMHDLIFAHQRAMKRDDLFAMAESLHLDMERFAKDLESGSVRAQIESERAEGVRRGVNGTPTYYIDGQELVGAASAAQFEAGIERSLRAKGIQTAKAQAPSDSGLSRGPEHAPVTVLWYSDVTSPLAVSADRLMGQLMKAYPGDVRVVFRNRPLEFHRDAMTAHQALMAAAAQGKFWALHDSLLAHQSALSAADLADYAGQVGLDTEKFVSDLTSQVLRDRVEGDVAQAREAGVNGVPVFFVNGTRVDGVQALASVKAVVDGEIKRLRVAAVHE